MRSNNPDNQSVIIFMRTDFGLAIPMRVMSDTVLWLTETWRELVSHTAVSTG